MASNNNEEDNIASDDEHETSMIHRRNQSYDDYIEHNDIDSKHAPKHPPKDTLVIFDNPEKKGIARLGEEEYMPNSTSRILLSAMPGCGKRNLIFNILHRMKPPPSIVHIVHHDPHNEEYMPILDMGIPVLMYSPDNFPTLENIDNPHNKESDDEEDPETKKKPLDNPLVIVDEVTADSLGKLGSHRFERLVNHICTHRNTTLMCSIQSLMSIPAKARRGFNHFALWKQADKQLNRLVADRASIRPEVLEDLFELCKDKYDFIYVDLDTPHDMPWRYRLNFIEPINIRLS